MEVVSPVAVDHPARAVKPDSSGDNNRKAEETPQGSGDAADAAAVDLLEASAVDAEDPAAADAPLADLPVPEPDANADAADHKAAKPSSAIARDAASKACAVPSLTRSATLHSMHAHSR